MGQTDPSPTTLTAVREALDRARFEEAEQLAEAFLAEQHLTARDRNDALELLAIVQIAARNTDAANQTLRLLFDRDAEHPQRVHDPGPAVDGAFARARSVAHTPVSLALTASARNDAYGRNVLDLQLDAGADAVNAVHVFVKADRDTRFMELVQEPSRGERMSVVLPAAPLGASSYAWYVEARAPSGLVLGRVAAPDMPRLSPLVPASGPAQARCTALRPEPLSHRWWVWTSVGIVAAGVAISGAIAAQ